MTPTQLLDKICHSFREKHLAAVAEFEAAARADERAKVLAEVHARIKDIKAQKTVHGGYAIDVVDLKELIERMRGEP